LLTPTSSASVKLHILVPFGTDNSKESCSWHH
jgi:hypothetical protein